MDEADALPPDEVLLVPAPPRPPEPATLSLATSALPLLGAGSGVALAVAARSPAFAAAAALSAAAAVLAPLLVARSARRRARARRTAAREAYLRHLDELEATAAQAAVAQRAALDRWHPSSADLVRAVLSTGRPPHDGTPSATHGSAVVRVGTGPVPARVRLALAGTAGPFVEVDDDLGLAAQGAVDRTTTLVAAAIAVDLLEARHVAVVGPPDVAGAVVRSWLVQLVLGPKAGGLDVAASGRGLEVVAPDGRRALVETFDRRDAVPETCQVLVVSQPDGTVRLERAVGAVELLPDVATDEAVAGVRQLLGRRLERATVAPTTTAVRLPDLLAETATASATAVPIGRGAAGEPVLVDTAEAAQDGHGPHGLLVGATGSGKSELLRTLVLGLAVRRPPSRLALLLVDFKGGAAFAPLVRLPHVAGLVTNLEDDADAVDRVRDAIDGELDRRQQLLRDTGCSSVHELDVLQGVPSLVLVVDEFGELLEQRPELLDTLVRVGRLGRSLGLHLLLSAQRLEEGRLRGLESHLRYRLALRTFTAAESLAVLGTTAAFELPARPGAGLLAVDGRVTRFQAPLTATTDAPHGPSDLDRVVADASDRADTVDGPGAAALPLLLPALPTSLPLTTAARAAGERADRGGVLGVADDPRRRRRVPLVLDLLGRPAHVALVGAAGSGRSSFLRALVVEHASRADPGGFQVYALDLGGGALTRLARLPHCGAVAGPHEPGSVARVLRHLTGRLADPPPPAGRPSVVLLVDDLARLRREHPDDETALVDLAVAGRAGGVSVVVTAGRWSDVRPALLDALDVRLELRLAEPAESAHGRSRAESVPRRPGRGLDPEGRPLQLAYAAGNECVRAHPGGVLAPRVRPLPVLVHQPAGGGDDGWALGVAESDLAEVRLDLLSPGEPFVVVGAPGSGRTTVLRRAVRHLAATGAGVAGVLLLDPTRSLLDVADLVGRDRHASDHDSAAALVARVAADLTDRARRVRDRDCGHRVGPAHVVVADDADLLAGPGGSALDALAPLLPLAGEVGLHVVIARAGGGSARLGYDAFWAALQRTRSTGFLLDGDRADGAQLAGVTATAQPPGRGLLVRRGRPVVVVQGYAPNDVSAARA